MARAHHDALARPDIRRSARTVGHLQVRHNVIDDLEDTLLATLYLLKLMKSLLLTRRFRTSDLSAGLIHEGAIGTQEGIGSLLIARSVAVVVLGIFIVGGTPSVVAVLASLDHCWLFLPLQVHFSVYLHG